MMKIYCCIALLFTVEATAGDLLPMSGQKEGHMQEALIRTLTPAVTDLPAGVTVEPVLESIDIHGRGRRLFWGPLAGSSHIVLRLRITDGDKVTDEVISTKAGAWKGTFRPGQDYAMVDRVANDAAEIVLKYSARQPTVQPLSDVVGQK